MINAYLYDVIRFRFELIATEINFEQLWTLRAKRCILNPTCGNDNVPPRLRLARGKIGVSGILKGPPPACRLALRMTCRASSLHPEASQRYPSHWSVRKGPPAVCILKRARSARQQAAFEPSGEDIGVGGTLSVEIRLLVYSRVTRASRWEPDRALEPIVNSVKIYRKAPSFFIRRASFPLR